MTALANMLGWWLLLAPPAAGTEVEAILQRLFPAAHWEERREVGYAKQSPDRVLLPIVRNGLKGYLPRSRAWLVKLPGGLAAVGFALFLTDPSVPMDDVLAGQAEKVASATTVLGLVLYHPAERKLIAKFPDFPLESTEPVMCMGDTCGRASDHTLKVVGSDSRGTLLQVGWERGRGSQGIRFYWLAKGAVSAALDELTVGALGGESGCDISIEIQVDKGEDGFGVLKTESCDPESCDCQAAVSMEPGVHKTYLHLLRP